MRIATPAALFALAALAACVNDSDMPEPPEGAALFARNCAACHGADAMGGDTLVSGKRPPDLTRLAARAGGDFPLTHVLSQIDGYGRGSLPAEAMPEFGALLDGPTVPVEVDGQLTPTPRPLAALAVYLESIQRP